MLPKSRRALLGRLTSPARRNARRCRDRHGRIAAGAAASRADLGLVREAAGALFDADGVKTRLAGAGYAHQMLCARRRTGRGCTRRRIRRAADQAGRTGRRIEHRLRQIMRRSARSMIEAAGSAAAVRRWQARIAASSNGDERSRRLRWRIEARRPRLTLSGVADVASGDPPRPACSIKDWSSRPGPLWVERSQRWK